MAAVKGSEMFEVGYLGPADKEAKNLAKTFVGLDKLILKTAKDSADLMKTLGAGKGVAEFKKLTKVFQDTNKARKASVTIDQQKIKLQTQLKALNSDSIQQNEVLKRQIQLQRKANKELANETLGLTNAYDKLVKKTDDAQKKFKRLAAEFGVNSKQAKKAKGEFDKLDSSLRKINADAKDGRRDVGRYGDAIKGTVGKLKNFAAALGVVGGVRLLTNVLRSSFDTIKQFDQSIANLSAITGATGDDLEFFKERAIELGKTTTLSATQVAEGFKLIASAKPELLEDADALASVTEQSIILAEAAGITLPEAASAITNALNQFGAGADQTAKFVDVLAAGSKFGAGDINFLNEALIKAGTVAANANLSIEGTAAALEVLAEKGVPASVAGTKLAGVITNLEKAGLGFASGQFDFNDALDDAKAKLDAIEDPAKRAQAEIQLFGKQNLAAGQTFLASGERLDELNQKLHISGVAAEQAAINNDTLEGAIKLLNSAWEGYILGADSAGGITDKFKVIVKFLADNLETIIDTIITVSKAFGAYKLVTFAVTKGVKLYTFAQNLATNGLKGFNKAAKANVFGAIAAALVVLLPLLIDAGKEIFGMTKEMNALDRVAEKVNEKLDEEKIALKQLGLALNETTTASEERQDVLDEINAKYGLTLQNLEDEAAFVAQLEEAYKGLVSQLESKLNAQIREEELKSLLTQERQLINQLKEAEEAAGGTFDIIAALSGNVALTSSAGVVNISNQLDKVKADIKLLNQEIAKTELNAADIDITATGEDVGSRGGGKSKREQFEDDRNARIEQLRRDHLAVLTALENKLVADGVDRELVADRVLKQQIQLAKRELALTKELFGEFSEEFIAEQKKFNDLVEKGNIERQKSSETEQLESHERQLDNEKTFTDIALKNLDDFVQKELDKRNKAREEAIKGLKEFAKQSIKIFQEITDGFNQSLDDRISKEQTEIDASEERINSLKQAEKDGSVDASKSLKLEEQRIAKSEREIDELEKKKRNLLVVTTGLKALTQAIDGGDKNAFANVGANIAQFLTNLPKFIEGTGTGTISDALGSPTLSGQDGHVVRVDGREKILNPAQSAMTGNQTADQIAYGAMMWHNDKGLARKAVNRGQAVIRHEDDKLNKLVKSITDGQNELKQSFDKIDWENRSIQYDEVTKILTDTVDSRNKRITTRTRKGGAFS